jgi:hypothetical protein
MHVVSLHVAEWTKGIEVTIHKQSKSPKRIEEFFIIEVVVG